MFSMFCFIFLFSVVDIIPVRSQSTDWHPFIADSRVKSENQLQEKLMLIPSIGYEMKDKPGKYTLLLSGWCFKPLTKSNLLHRIVKIGFRATSALFGANERMSEEKQEEILGPFLVRDVAKHGIKLKLTRSMSQIVRTDENGRFSDKIFIDSLEGLTINGNKLTYTASDEHSNRRGDEGLIYLMKNEHGCSIISDIDDTIKISEVTNKKKLIINTFQKDFQVVAGMSELYRYWESSYQCLIHYVSAMPAQLYYATQKFLNEEKFPGGSFHMRHLKLAGKDKYQILKKISEFADSVESEAHKLISIKHIFDQASVSHQFVMVGDSGELDPEIYGEIARKYPQKVKMIFIRLVDGGTNSNYRFEVAFRNVSKEKWHTFYNASEILKDLFPKDDLINTKVVTKLDETTKPDDAEEVDDDVEEAEDAEEPDDVEDHTDTGNDIDSNQAVAFSISMYYHICPVLLTVLSTILCL